MTERARKAWSSYWWKAGGTIGLAFIAAAVVLVLSSAPGAPMPVVHAQTETPTETPTPTDTATPTVTPTPNPDCELRVRKTDDPDPVAEGGQITYTITVENNGDGDDYCTDLTVTDTIPDGTDCVEIGVEDAPSGFDMDFDEDDCDSHGDVTWDTNDNLDTGDEVVLTMVVELEDDVDEGDEIENEACATSEDDELGDCDTEKTDVEGEAATATPAPTSTPYVYPTVAPTVAPVPVILPAPAAQEVPSLVAPPTGSGSASGGGMNALALALGLAGGTLLLVSGAGLWVRRTR